LIPHSLRWLPLLALALACGPTGGVSPDDSAPPADTDTDTDTDSDSDADTDADADSDTDTDTQADPPLVAWVVRHAEKESSGSDPHLTEEGHARAQALAEVMADVPLAAVYATDYNRTQETCLPTAEDQGLSMVTDIDPYDDLANHIIAEHQHEQILHCGHSWTIPGFMEYLGVPEPISIASDQWGDIWIVTMRGDEVISVELGHFGD
jgi:2,3-bisphosphoglycerate-dependent phosphoglycerate mutase